MKRIIGVMASCLWLVACDGAVASEAGAYEREAAPDGGVEEGDVASSDEALVSTTAWCIHGGSTMHSGDFNGDGHRDFLCRDRDRLWIDLVVPRRSRPGSTDAVVDTHFCTHSGATFYLADVNGDRRTDYVCRDSAAVWVVLNNAPSYFGLEDRFETGSFCPPTDRLFVTDMNADGRADLVCRSGTSLLVSHAHADGSYDMRVSWSLHDLPFCTHAGATIYVADVTGDRRADLVCHDRGGVVTVDDARRSPPEYGTDTPWSRDLDYCIHAGARLSLEDYDGNRTADLICEDINGQWTIYAVGGMFEGTPQYHERL